MKFCNMTAIIWTPIKLIKKLNKVNYALVHLQAIYSDTHIAIHKIYKQRLVIS